MLEKDPNKRASLEYNITFNSKIIIIKRELAKDEWINAGFDEGEKLYEEL